MIVLVGQTKGGVGKSMIAANVAAMAATKGKSVLLVDADRQQTCNKWSSTRMLEGVSPDVRVMCMNIDANTSAKEFAKSVELLDTKFDLVLLDCGGQDKQRTSFRAHGSRCARCPVSPDAIGCLGPR